jgi:hypothetical protein
VKGDFRTLLAGAAAVGALGGLLHSMNSPTLAEAATPRPEADATAIVHDTLSLPIAATVSRAARAVLDGVGIESGLAHARVNRALDALQAGSITQSHPDAMRMAFHAYYRYQAAHPDRVRKPYLFFVDYGLDNRTPRGWVFDMQSLAVVEGPFTVSHGSGSAETGGIPTRFSNRKGSNATSLGLYLAEETYAFRGRTGGRTYSSIGLRLTGVSGRYNSAARTRGIVVHGAPYVTPARAGRSEGCPAMEPQRAERLIPRIANGGMVFHFSPKERGWMTEDPWAGLAVAPRLAR